MGTGLGTKAKCAFRIESDQGLVNADYPKSASNADDEEINLGSSDKVPFLSESIEEDHQFELDETLDGSPGVTKSERVALLGGGALEVQGMYDGLDQLIACAMGYEHPGTDGSPAYPDYTVGTAEKTGGADGTQGSTKIVDEGSSHFATGDVGKFIVLKGVNAAAGQVRRISAYVGTTELTITPAWAVNPIDLSTSYVISQEYGHLYELAPQLHDQLWTDVYSSYPTTGVGTANDQIIRRGTIGIEKGQTKPWIWRGCMVNSMTISCNAGESAKFSFELVPFDLDRDSATNTAHSGWDIDHDSGLFQENELITFDHLDYFRIGTFSTAVSLDSGDEYGINSFSITLNNNLKIDDQDADTGIYRVEPARGGMREITGTITLPRYDADTFIDWQAHKTTLMAQISLSGSTIRTIARQILIELCSLEITGKSVAVAGAGVLTQSFDFRCLIPDGQPSGLSAHNITSPRSEFTIYTKNQFPWNTLRQQNPA